MCARTSMAVWFIIVYVSLAILSLATNEMLWKYSGHSVAGHMREAMLHYWQKNIAEHQSPVRELRFAHKPRDIFCLSVLYNNAEMSPATRVFVFITKWIFTTREEFSVECLSWINMTASGLSDFRVVNEVADACNCCILTNHWHRPAHSLTRWGIPAQVSLWAGNAGRYIITYIWSHDATILAANACLHPYQPQK